MDEVEKYQQRLQTIAEKQRLQEEQDRARRELEDEKLRLQQLKRKSLRDQWLMEGSPLSPSSEGPRSPLWSPKAQNIEKNIDKFQTEIEKTHQHVEDGVSAQTQNHQHDHHERAVTPPPSNIRDSGSSSPDEEDDDDEEEATETLPVLTLTNGMYANDGAKKAETLLFLGYTEADPGQGLCEEEDESASVIRAEKVIINEDGEELVVAPEGEETPAYEEEEEPEEVRNDEDEEEAEFENRLENSAERGETSEPNPNQLTEAKANSDSEEDAEAILENLSQSSAEENSDSETSINVMQSVILQKPAGPAAEMSGGGVSADAKDDSESNPPLNDKPVTDIEEVKAIDELLGAPTSPQNLFQTPEGAPPASSSVPNTNSGQDQQSLSLLFPNAQDQFLDIPLDEETVEEEPLMATRVEPLTDATKPKRADAPKTKTCQCCSVM